MSTGVNGNRTYRWLAGLLGALTLLAATLAPSAAAETSIGNLGQTLHVDFKGLVADVTVHNVLPSDEPPGWTCRTYSIRRDCDGC
ncbi:MAG: hypothetical protein J0H22_08815 [Actinobacteria bacterium]|nr:hypothetical protein [Actinomycetota bacterium]